MALSYGKGGAGAAGAPRPTPVPSDDRGSQALEFALVLPLAVLLMVLGVHAGLLAADLVAVQGLAREAARVAAVGDDDLARRALEEAAGRRPVRLALSPSPRAPGDLVTAEVRLESVAFRALGLGPRIWLPARAAMRVEDS